LLEPGSERRLHCHQPDRSAISVNLETKIITTDFILDRKMILQEVTEETEDEEMMQNPSFTRKLNELRPGFRSNPLNPSYLC